MQKFNPDYLKKLYIPPADSHKGQNGKLLIIGGSSLFHAASLWALTIASKIVDMVFYASVPENNQIVHELKKEFRNGIIVPRSNIESYIDEADCVLIGPGMERTAKTLKAATEEPQSLGEIASLEDEGLQAYFLTKYLLLKYPGKKWVIDAGALQMLEPVWLRPLKGNVIVTPHPVEFDRAESKDKENAVKGKTVEQRVALFAKTYACVVLLKGESDIVCSEDTCLAISGGNSGMTKGGTGDVLAGLVAALACKNDMFLAAAAGSYFNKKAGEALFERVGYYFNSSDLAEEIPVVMKKILG
jgi:hydroxyethylthiazole kinase-like uncharacterized protein yjeF